MFLSDLLQEVHEHIYKEKARFHLVALPRLEIQGMEDLKTLHEIGVLQPDHAIQLSEVLLGPSPASKRRKVQPAAKVECSNSGSNGENKKKQELTNL